MRQLWDAKASVPIESDGRRRSWPHYGEVCGWTLARAHARSGDRDRDRRATSARGDRFDRALADFAETYADQNERDYAALAAAVEAGDVAADRDR